MSWITIQYKDDQGRILYHKKQNGAVYSRIHVYENPAFNLTPEEMPVAIWAQTT